jgi:hypothetical protein
MVSQFPVTFNDTQSLVKSTITQEIMTTLKGFDFTVAAFSNAICESAAMIVNDRFTMINEGLKGKSNLGDVQSQPVFKPAPEGSLCKKVIR